MYLNKDDVNNKKIYADMFCLIVKFIAGKNKELNIKVDISENKEKFNKEQNNFFENGQLLMFLYVFSIMNLRKNEIGYLNDVFYIDLSEQKFEGCRSMKSDSESIAEEIINKSVYTDESLMIDFNIKDFRNEKKFKDFKEGFKICYETFLREKNNAVIELLNRGLDNSYLIRNIKSLNLRDLDMQLRFIDIKNNVQMKKNTLIEKIEQVRNDPDNFINMSMELADFINKNSIIGINNEGSIETTWIKYNNRKICTIGIEKVYLAAYFAYIGRESGEKYYTNTAKSSIIPLLDTDSDNYKKIKDDQNILNVIYWMNYYSGFRELDNFVKENKEMFINSRYYLKRDEKAVFKYMLDESINVMKSLVLV